MTTRPNDPHDLETGGHEPVDVDPYLPTGVCATCLGVVIDERPPDERGPENPYEPTPALEADPLEG